MTHEYGYNWTPAEGQAEALSRATGCKRWPCREACGACASKDYCEKYARYREAKRWEKKGG